jgi:integrase
VGKSKTAAGTGRIIPLNPRAVAALRDWRGLFPGAQPEQHVFPHEKRKRVEQSFGWMKMIGMLKKVKLRGIDKVGWLFTFTGAAYNLCRLRNLMARA